MVIQSVPITWKSATSRPNQPENVSLTVRGGPGGTCEVYWNLTRVTNEELLDRAVKALEQQIERVGGVQNINEENMPEVHIRGDINTPYKCRHRQHGVHAARWLPARRLYFSPRPVVRSRDW